MLFCSVFSFWEGDCLAVKGVEGGAGSDDKGAVVEFFLDGVGKEGEGVEVLELSQLGDDLVEPAERVGMEEEDLEARHVAECARDGAECVVVDRQRRQPRQGRQAPPELDYLVVLQVQVVEVRKLLKPC